MGWFDAFTGAAQQRALRQGYQQQRSDLQNGFDEGRGYGENYLRDANGAMQGYIDRGNKASDLYSNLNGVNGADAAKGAWQWFQAPPGFDQAVTYANKQTQNSAAARGGMYNGNTLAALYNQSAGMRLGEQRDWMNPLQGIGNQGFTASQGNADRTSNFGNALMMGRWNLGNQLGQADQASGRDMAGAAGTGWQNFVNLLGAGGRMWGGTRS